MNRRGIIAVALTAALLLAALAQTAFAGSQTIDGITFKGPGNRSLCVNGPSSDTISITGVTGHKPAASIQGEVNAYYILNNGASRQLFHTYHISQSRNLSLTVNYPPVSQWPMNNANTREVHVDVAIQVSVGGKVVGEFDGNPNLGWDRFCTTTITSPTATRTSSPGTTTATPLSTATPSTPGPTATPNNSTSSSSNALATAVPTTGASPTTSDATVTAAATVTGTVTTAQATTTLTARAIPVTGTDFQVENQAAFALFTIVGTLLVGIGVAMRRLTR